MSEKDDRRQAKTDSSKTELANRIAAQTAAQARDPYRQGWHAAHAAMVFDFIG